MKSITILYFFIFFVINLQGQIFSDAELVSAIRKDNVEYLENKIDSLNINRMFKENLGTPLLLAVELNSSKIVEYLLIKGADPNIGFLSRTPLMYAVQKQNISIVRVLLKYGAEVNIIDSLGNTALMMAAANSNLKIVKILIKNGASLNHRNKKGLNARDFAVRSNNRTISIYLKNIFEHNLPNYSDGPYLNYINKNKIKVSYFKHDSLRKRSESISRSFKINGLDDQFSGFDDDQYLYPIIQKFKRPPSEVNNVKKLLIIGDVHGQYDTLKLFLQNNQVIDKDLHWTFGSGMIVFIGDILDRGEKVTEALWLILKLEKEAPIHGGMVQLLLGNHELMVLQENERFISEKYYYLFKNLKLNYSRFFNNQALFGKWLRSRNTFLKVDSFLFVHGGIHPELLHHELSIDSANILMFNFLNTRRTDKFKTNSVLQFLLSYKGPYWYRGMVEHSNDNILREDEVSNILTEYNVKHIVVGHTFKPQIQTFYNSKVISTDIPFYLPDGFPMQALLFEEHKFVILNSQGERLDFKLQ